MDVCVCVCVPSTYTQKLVLLSHRRLHLGWGMVALSMEYGLWHCKWSL